MQTNGVGIASQRLAIDDSRASPKIAKRRPQIQAHVSFPGIVCDHASAVGAYVFRESLLGAIADVETTKIHANSERSAFFRTVRNRLHKTPHDMSKTNEGGRRGGIDKGMIRQEGLNWQRFPADTGAIGPRVVP